MSPDAVLPLLEHYTYLVLFPLAVVEGPVITIIAGFLVSLGILDPFISYGVVVAGDIAGDSLWYGVGRFGSPQFVALLERWFGISQERLSAVRERMRGARVKTVLFSKLVQGIGFVGIIAAGMARIPFLPFMLTAAAVSFTQSLAFFLIGMLFGSAYAHIAHLFGYVADASVLAALLVMLLALRSYKNKPR